MTVCGKTFQDPASINHQLQKPALEFIRQRQKSSNDTPYKLYPSTPGPYHTTYVPRSTFAH